MMKCFFTIQVNTAIKMRKILTGQNYREVLPLGCTILPITNTILSYCERLPDHLASVLYLCLVAN